MKNLASKFAIGGAVLSAVICAAYPPYMDYRNKQEFESAQVVLRVNDSNSTKVYSWKEIAGFYKGDKLEEIKVITSYNPFQFGVPVESRLETYTPENPKFKEYEKIILEKKGKIKKS